MLKNVILLVIGALAAVAVPAAIAKAASPNVIVAGGSPTASLGGVAINKDGSQTITLFYANTAGQLVSVRTLTIDSGCTRVTDNLGNLVSATGPTAECAAAASFVTSLQTTITSAASALAL